jgi:hypothetical protein
MTRATDGNGARPAGDADRVDQQVDDSLSALAVPPIDAPPLGEDLARELASIRPVRTRAPRLESAAVLGLSLVSAAAVVAWIGMRSDVDALPRVWMVAVGGLWLASYVSITWLVLVPPRRQVMPRWRWAAGLSALAAVVLVASGMLLPGEVAAAGTSYSVSFSSWVEHGHRCLRAGLAVALVPVVLTAMAMRSALPVGSRWLAAAIGAAGGALGGLTLHMHCPIGERFHVGLVHGGLVIVAALIAALAARVAEAGRRPGRPQRLTTVPKSSK